MSTTSTPSACLPPGASTPQDRRAKTANARELGLWTRRALPSAPTRLRAIPAGTPPRVQAKAQHRGEAPHDGAGGAAHTDGLPSLPGDESSLSPSTPASRWDLYHRVTERIVCDLEQGVRPWMPPWRSPATAARPLRVTGQAYRGINVVLLWAEARRCAYASPVWMTYRQALEHGGQVRAGSKGCTVVYSSEMQVTQADAQGQECERAVRFLKAYTVFNADQISGLAPELRRVHACCSEAPDAAATALSCPHSVDHPDAAARKAHAFATGVGAQLIHGGDRACYLPALDRIDIPCLSDFDDAGAYGATLAHELVHWSGHPSRCARHYGRHVGDAAYAREELVAEMGAAFLCAELGISAHVRQDHAAYLSTWLGILREDAMAVFQAAGQAQRACDYLHALHGELTERTDGTSKLEGAGHT